FLPSTARSAALSHPLPYTPLFRSPLLEGAVRRATGCQRGAEDLGAILNGGHAPLAVQGEPRNAEDAVLGDDPLVAALLCVAKLRSEEHTSELQSRENLVCRLLLEK